MKALLTSTQNRRVKQWKSLQRKKGRMQTGKFWIEGFHLVEEAINSEWMIDEIIVRADVQLPYEYARFPVTTVNDRVFNALSQTKTPQGIGAVVHMRSSHDVAGRFVSLIDRVQDPGNLGTMIRTADAAGFDAVVLSDDSVDMYNDKVIRATQGALFHLPVVQDDLTPYLKHLKQSGFTVWAAALQNANIYSDVPRSDKIALIVGNEASGIHPDRLEQADAIVKIPIHGKVESLNVSVAAGILMYYAKG